MFELIKEMHTAFGVKYNGLPRQMPKDEFEFRIKAFYEEINEYIAAYHEGDIEGQFDALIDLIVFAMGAAEKQGFDFPEGFNRVMEANLQKELVTSAEQSKRGHKEDLIKPEGWRAPYLGDLVTTEINEYRGIIILEGPDCCGKTTLGKYLEEHFGALYIHSTWSPELDKRMAKYLAHSADIAQAVSKNQLVVLDRHWITDLVYSDVFRGGHNLYMSSIYNHTKLLNDSNGMLVMCLPENSNNIISQFESKKVERNDLYYDMSDVVKAYLALWEGNTTIHAFKNNDQYINALIKHNGLKSHPCTIQYDWTTDGQDMNKFCTYIMENFHG